MSYCSIDDVEALRASGSGPGNTVRTILSISTSPTLAQATQWITDIADEIDTTLAAAQVLTPVTTPASFVGWLLRVNALGVAWQVEQAQFPESDGGPGESPQWKRYRDEYYQCLAGIKDKSMIDPAATPSGTTTYARTYLTDNPDNSADSDGTTPGQQPYFRMSKDW